MYGSDVDELALLSLQESYSLPILMYAIPALYLKSKQLYDLMSAGIMWLGSHLITINGSLLSLFYSTLVVSMLLISL